MKKNIIKKYLLDFLFNIKKNRVKLVSNGNEQMKEKKQDRKRTVLKTTQIKIKN